MNTQKFPLLPWSDAAYQAALNVFTGAAPAPVTTPVATVEYVQALKVALASGNAVEGVSLLAIDQMSPAVADFAHNGDFRDFVPTQAFLDDVAQHVASIIGTSNWFTTPFVNHW